jgi:hypothetical protein
MCAELDYDSIAAFPRHAYMGEAEETRLDRYEAQGDGADALRGYLING